MIRRAVFLILVCVLASSSALSQTPPTPAATAIWNALASVAMDPSRFAHAENVTITRDKVHITLVDGTIQFTQPVNGVVLGAVFRLERVIKAAAQVGARFVHVNPLFLKPCAEKVFMPFLEEQFPHLVATYRERYADRAYLPDGYHKRISALAKKYREKYKIGLPDRRPPQRVSSPQELLKQMDLFGT
ncbi:MAG TPA: hypothetical protein VI685_28280 [Candidatus Angelobacter sp.]